jgi:hypothetical protein
VPVNVSRVQKLSPVGALALSGAAGSDLAGGGQKPTSKIPASPARTQSAILARVTCCLNSTPVSWRVWRQRWSPDDHARHRASQQGKLAIIVTKPVAAAEP